VDGHLRHDERDRALAHLAHCVDCRLEVTEYRRMKQRVASLWSPALPDTRADRLVGLDLAAVLVGQGLGQGPARRGLAGRLGGWGSWTLSGRRGPAARPPVVTGAAVTGMVAFGPLPRPRLSAPPGVGGAAAAVLLVGGVVEACAPVAAGRPARRRMRRTVVSSAALMLLTVACAAVSDQSAVAAGGPVGPVARPTVVPATLPTSNASGTTPLIATVSIALRG
jgi:hypothetical protein